MHAIHSVKKRFTARYSVLGEEQVFSKLKTQAPACSHGGVAMLTCTQKDPLIPHISSLMPSLLCEKQFRRGRGGMAIVTFLTIVM
jgi:hypothetical protein